MGKYLQFIIKLNKKQAIRKNTQYNLIWLKGVHSRHIYYMGNYIIPRRVKKLTSMITGQNVNRDYFWAMRLSPGGEKSI